MDALREGLRVHVPHDDAERDEGARVQAAGAVAGADAPEPERRRGPRQGHQEDRRRRGRPLEGARGDLQGERSVNVGSGLHHHQSPQTSSVCIQHYKVARMVAEKILLTSNYDVLLFTNGAVGQLQ